MDILDKGLLADVLPRIVLNPLTAAALAATCTWLRTLVAATVVFEEADLQRYHRDGVLQSRYYTCYPEDYCDPTRYNESGMEYPDLECQYDSDDCDIDSNEPRGDEDFWYEYAPDYVIEFSYHRDADRVLGVHSCAVPYIRGAALYQFEKIVYRYLIDDTDPCDDGVSGDGVSGGGLRKDALAYQLSGCYYAIYLALPAQVTQATLSLAPTTTALVPGV